MDVQTPRIGGAKSSSWAARRSTPNIAPFGAHYSSRSLRWRLRGEAAPDSRPVYQMAFDTASKTIDLGATPSELESVLRAYVEDISPPVVLTIAQRYELVGEAGQWETRGVIAGMVFAVVTRAPYGARSKLFQSLDWWKASCMLRGFASNAKEDKKFPMDTRRGLEKIAEREVFERLRSLLPIQPGDEFVRGVAGVRGHVSSKMWRSSPVFARRLRRPERRVTIWACGWR